MPEPITDEVLTRHAKKAIDMGHQYIQDHLGMTNKLVEYNADGSINDERTNAIRQFLLDAPYNDKLDLTKAIIKDMVGDIPAATGTRKIAFVSGAYGSQVVWEEAVKNGNPHAQELKELWKADPPVSLQVDFRKLKASFDQHNGQGKSLTVLPEAPNYEPYGKWRGLFNGINESLAQIARETNRNYVEDSSFAPGDAKTRQQSIDYLKAAGNDAQVHMFATALTPEESAALVPDNRKAEARQSARNFHAFFNTIAANVENITLVNTKGEEIYSKRGNDDVVKSRAEYLRWHSAFPPEQGQSAPSQLLPLPVQKGQSR